MRLRVYLHKVLLALVQRPGSGEAPTVFAGVAVAKHDLLMVAVYIPAIHASPSQGLTLSQ